MQKSTRTDIKVGLFVGVGLLLLAALLLQFSKNTSLFQKTYELRLKATNVGGIKPRANVLLAGVQVGIVDDIKLAADGRTVTIILKIYDGFKVCHDARFVIEQSGFLGDQYVAIEPTKNEPPYLADGAEVPCAPPFDLQEVARTASGFIDQLNVTAKKLDASVNAIQQMVLNDKTLTNLSLTIINAHAISEQALDTVKRLNQVVATNREQVTVAVSNLVAFSAQLNHLADSAQALLVTNGGQIDVATKNIADTSASLKSVVSDVQNGKGLAGTILQNPALAANVQAIASNLALTTSNLNQVGLWGILWAPKHHKSNPTEPATPTNNPK